MQFLAILAYHGFDAKTEIVNGWFGNMFPNWMLLFGNLLHLVPPIVIAESEFEIPEKKTF